jgi:hypothetical protein
VRQELPRHADIDDFQSFGIKTKGFDIQQSPHFAEKDIGREISFFGRQQNLVEDNMPVKESQYRQDNSRKQRPDDVPPKLFEVLPKVTLCRFFARVQCTLFPFCCDNFLHTEMAMANSLAGKYTHAE